MLCVGRCPLSVSGLWNGEVGWGAKLNRQGCVYLCAVGGCSEGEGGVLSGNGGPGLDRAGRSKAGQTRNGKG